MYFTREKGKTGEIDNAMIEKKLRELVLLMDLFKSY